MSFTQFINSRCLWITAFLQFRCYRSVTTYVQHWGRLRPLYISWDIKNNDIEWTVSQMSSFNLTLSFQIQLKIGHVASLYCVHWWGVLQHTLNWSFFCTFSFSVMWNVMFSLLLLWNVVLCFIILWNWWFLLCCTPQGHCTSDWLREFQFTFFI